MPPDFIPSCIVLFRFIYSCAIFLLLAVNINPESMLTEHPNWVVLQSIKDQRKETLQTARIILSRNPGDLSAKDFLLRN